MKAPDRPWDVAARWPVTTMAIATVLLALLAWATGQWLSAAWRPIGMWPLAAVMLGWLSAAPAILTGDDGRSQPVAAERRRAALAVLTATATAALAIALAALATTGAPLRAALASLAGVVLPAIGAGLLARVEVRAPARGVGTAELRLLAAAMAIAPLATLVRAFDPVTRTLAPGLPDHLVADLLAAGLFAPMAASLAQGAVARLHGRPGRTASIRAKPLAIGLAAGAIAAGAAMSVGLRLAGQEDLARVVAVAHLAIGMQVARAIAGVPGALMLAANGAVMASTFASAFRPTTLDDLERARELATLLLLGGAFAMMSVLHSVSTNSREAARALIRQALRSDLSGLPNQRALLRIVGALLDHPSRTKFWLVGVVLPDIARWSDLTDSAAAAELERSVAGRLRADFEPLGAKLAHPSSGRFVITLGDRADGIAIRQRLRATLGGQRFDTSEQSIQLRYHAGMVEVPPNATVSADAVLTTLSMSLQRAANDPAGMHRATVSDALLDDYRTELRMVEVVGRALDSGRVRLYAERIEPVSRRTEGHLHFEVLVRVLDDDDTVLQPKQFLPAIWHAGLHSKLDRLVFVRTVAHLAAHRALHDATHLCSINVCGPTLCDPEFPEYVKRCLKTYTVDPRRLMIEITESAAISDIELARAHVARLSDMGLAIALDDFGTGLATFDYLKRLRADVLKIDGSFVRKVVDDPLDREIVSTIVRMARATGARTVAEWIETPEQRDLVSELGVDYLQGHLIAKPVPIESLLLPRQRDDPRDRPIPYGDTDGADARPDVRVDVRVDVPVAPPDPVRAHASPYIHGDHADAAGLRRRLAEVRAAASKRGASSAAAVGRPGAAGAPPARRRTTATDPAGR